MGHGMTVVNLHLGKSLGDLLKVKIQNLGLPVDFIISGPPCPPWAGNGCRRSLGDARASVFVQCLAWTLFLIKCGGLLCCIMENVTGILQSRDGFESTGMKFLRILRAFAPEFAWLHLLSPIPHFLKNSIFLSSTWRGWGSTREWKRERDSAKPTHMPSEVIIYTVQNQMTWWGARLDATWATNKKSSLKSIPLNNWLKADLESSPRSQTSIVKCLRQPDLFLQQRLFGEYIYIHIYIYIHNIFHTHGDN